MKPLLLLTPALLRRQFGVDSTQSPWSGGNHNLFYSASSASTATKGQETLTTFVNSVADEAASSSFVFEFALKLTAQTPGKQYTDAVFATNHTRAACGFTAQVHKDRCSCCFLKLNRCLHKDPCSC